MSGFDRARLKAVVPACYRALVVAELAAAHERALALVSTCAGCGDCPCSSPAICKHVRLDYTREMFIGDLVRATARTFDRHAA